MAPLFLVTTSNFKRLCEIVARLRAPGGCPWDREQTNESLLPGLLEEAYEAAAAIRARDDLNLREELGDIVLQAVMHAEIAREQGRFGIEDALSDVTEKLIRRHPHVFGTAEAADSGAVLKQWDAIKREEKNDPGRHYLADLPVALPALMRAQKAQSKAARVKFDWAEISDVIAKVDEELAETKAALSAVDREGVAAVVGDLLFAVVNLARKQALDAETLLQSATDKFVRRFHAVEDELRARGQQLGEVELPELDAIWNAHKANPAAPAS